LTGNVSNSPNSAELCDPCFTKSSYSDLNGDGFTDIKLFFDTPCLNNPDYCQLSIADEEVTLNAMTKSGTQVAGKDMVHIIKE
jgi:hypothetical protein